MKISKTCIAVLLLTTCVAGQTKLDDQYTGTFLNGRAWREWDRGMRVTFLMGYSEGLNVGAISGYALGTPGGTHPIEESALRSIRDGFNPASSMTYGETERALDRFYEDPLNDQIPIHQCLRIVARQHRGDDPKLIDNAIRDLRKSAAQGSAKEQK